MQRNLGCAAMLSAAQKEGDFAGARVVSQAFRYLIECNYHFYQADTYFLSCTLLKCSGLKDNNCSKSGCGCALVIMRANSE